MSEDYIVLYPKDLANSHEVEMLLDFWEEVGVYSREVGRSRIPQVVVSLKHIPSGKIVGVMTAKLMLRPSLGGKYYRLGIIVAPGNSSRPLLLPLALEYLEKYREGDAKGVALKRKNKKISDRLLKRYGFSPFANQFTHADKFYRDF
jgi:hypothetical protein